MRIRYPILAALTALLVVLPAAPASAAGVEVSFDGFEYERSPSRALFDGLGHLVPGDSVSEQFYVRNGGGQPGFLRVTMREVSWSDRAFAEKLSVRASTPGFGGEGPIAITSADPCHVLVSGQLMQPGFTVGVTTTVSLADLDGQEGMGESARFSVRVTLSDTAPSLAATDCGGEGYDIPVLSGPGGSRATATSPGIIMPGAGQGPDAGGGGGSDERDHQSTIATGQVGPNTWRLDDYLVYLALLAAAAGGAGYVFAAWMRRRRDEDREVKADDGQHA